MQQLDPIDLIGKEVYAALTYGRTQIKTWNNDKLKMLAWLTKSYSGKFNDFYSITAAAMEHKRGLAMDLFESVSVAQKFSDEQILRVLELKHDWDDDGIVFTQESRKVIAEVPQEATNQTYQEQEIPIVVEEEPQQVADDATFPEAVDVNNADYNKPPFQNEQEVEWEVIPVKAPLLLPERATSSIEAESEGVPKTIEVSQMSPYTKWDRTTSILRTANERLNSAKDLAPVKQLLGEFWGDGELHVLFADTGVGKSLLAVDIADHLSRGKSLLGLVNECEPLKTIYYDFELTDRQK